MKKVMLLLALMVGTGILAAGCSRTAEPDAAVSTSTPTAQEAVDMSTEALVEAVLTSPEIVHLRLYNTYRSGVENFARHSPVAAELLARPDNAAALLNAYQDTSPPRSGESAADTAAIERLDVLGILLAQPEVTANMDDGLRAEMEQAAAEKDAELETAASPLNTYREAEAELADS